MQGPLTHSQEDRISELKDTLKSFIQLFMENINNIIALIGNIETRFDQTTKQPADIQGATFNTKT